MQHEIETETLLLSFVYEKFQTPEKNRTEKIWISKQKRKWN